MMSAAPTAANKLGRLLEEATSLHRAGDLAGAEAAYRKILKANPRDPDGLHLLGAVRADRGAPQEGAAFIKQALQVRDDFPDAHLNLGNILSRHLGDLDGAEHHLNRAVQQKPTPQAYGSLGNLLRARGRHDAALAAFRGAMDSDPRNVDGCIMYTRALRMTDDAAAMLAAAQKGLALAPQNPTLHLLASEALFALGRLKEGWHDYRWRFTSAENPTPPKAYALPTWHGEPLSERAILVWTEQGPGDEIMYANMFPDVIAAAKRCVVQCSPRLAPLMRRAFPAAEIYDRDLTETELTGIDVQSSAGSLGEWLRPTFDAFPRARSYLTADTVRRDALRAKYLEGGTSVLVGLAWKSAKVEGAADKSTSLLEWGPILQMPGVTFVNLQYGDCAHELQDAMKGFGIRIVDDADIDPLRDIDGHAAQIAAMDVVVTSSNTAAHVAGALGVPTLCMLPSSLGRGRRWYWFAGHGDCPWYPSLRRFVQRQAGDWLGVLREAALALTDIIAARGTAVTPYLRSLAKAFAGAKRYGDAEAYYLRLAADPGFAASANFAIAEIRKAALDATGALTFYDRAIAADAALWQAYNMKGALLARLNRFDEAVTAYKAGLIHKPAAPELHNNLGTALLRLGRSDEALPHYEAARANSADRDATLQDSIALNHAGALHDVGQTDKAIDLLSEILVRSPSSVEAHHNRAQNRLSIGRFADGWREAEWRLKRPGANVQYEAFAPVPRWNGEDIAGKRVLVWTEQGIGDEILTASMIPDAIAVAEHVTILCSARLVPLFRRSFPTASVEERRAPLPTSARDPRLAFQMSLADLGAAFRPDLAHFPDRPKFLTADEAQREELRTRYQAAHPGTALVGLSWSSHGNSQMGWLKSNNLEAWGPILTTPDVTFVNLQYGDRADELARIHAHFGVRILSDASVDPMKDMDRFAAQVAAMDLVISTSNSTVHTAGALGVPIWMLAPKGRGRHWYWFRNRDDSPWYPSLRLIQQTDEGGWEGAIARCAEDLGAWAPSHRKYGET